MSAPDTDVAVRELGGALVSSDTERVEKALRALIAATPRWRRLIARLDAVEDPSSPSFDLTRTIARFAPVVEVAKGLVSDGTIAAGDAQWLASLSLASAEVGSRLNKIRARLEEMTFFSDSLATQTFRLGVLIEHQIRMGQRHAIHTGVREGTFDPHSIMTTNLHTPVGGHISVLAALEGAVDAVELILRFSHFKASKGNISGTPLSPKTPFNDPELHRLLIYASTWNVLADAYGDVRFAEWVFGPTSLSAATPNGEDKRIFELAPSSADEDERRYLGGLREQMVLAQFSTDLSQHSHYSDSPTGQAVARLRQSLARPTTASPWNGRFDQEALRAGATHMRYTTMGHSWAKFRNYEPLVDAVRLDTTTLSWTEWLHAHGVMALLCAALSSPETVVDPATFDWEGAVVVARIPDLVEVIRAAGVLSEEKARAALGLLTFSAKRRSLELWDQPLLPVDGDRVLLVPSLVTAGSPTRAMENATQQWPLRDQGVRGAPFEIRVRDDIAALCPGVVDRGIRFMASDGLEVEFDIIWWWNGHLLLIETKCIRSVHSSAEFLHAKEEVEYAIEQLARRRRLATSDWATLRGAARGLGLPEAFPGPAFVSSIALTNLLAFTPWEKDGTIVTDDLCLRRYFGNEDMSVYQASPDGGRELLRTIGYVRVGPPSPSGFLDYLRCPPQLEVTSQGIVRNHAPLAPVDAMDTPIAQVFYEFTPRNAERKDDAGT